MGKNWLQKWDIQEHNWRCRGKKIHRMVKQKIISKLWSNVNGKKKFYLQEIRGGIDRNPNYLSAAIPFLLQTQISRLRLSSHHLRVKRGKWLHLDRMDHTYQPISIGAIEEEHHVFLKCYITETLQQKWEIKTMSLVSLFNITPMCLENM